MYIYIYTHTAEERIMGEWERARERELSVYILIDIYRGFPMPSSLCALCVILLYCVQKWIMETITETPFGPHVETLKLFYVHILCTMSNRDVSPVLDYYIYKYIYIIRIIIHTFSYILGYYIRFIIISYWFFLSFNIDCMYAI